MPFGQLKIRAVLCILLASCISYANAPRVGKAAAAKYFEKAPEAQGKNTRTMASEGVTSGAEDRFLAVGISSFTKSESYNWGNNSEQSIGKLGLDLSYKLSQTHYVDYGLRISYSEYVPLNQKANKMSFLYAVTLPDSNSKFPLFFGAAAGPGIFFTQLKDESSITLDYQLFLGLRIFNLFDSTGFYIEGGMKNHLQLTSDGQLNGTYISAGVIFTF